MKRFGVKCDARRPQKDAKMINKHGVMQMNQNESAEYLKGDARQAE